METPATPVSNTFDPGNWTAGLRPLAVLLVEDNKVNQEFATLILGNAGHKVEIAETGCQAVEWVRRSDFDVIVMDIQMPELDGIEAARQIRKLKQPKRCVPIIVASAHVLADAREDCVAAGMDDYISKPFSPALLLSKLANISDKKHNNAPVGAFSGPDEHSGELPIEGLPVVDLDQLDALEGMFSLPELRTLVAHYLADVSARVTLISEHRAQGDFKNIARQAHMIVATAGNVGAKRTSAMAGMLEASCATGDDAAIDRRISALYASSYISSYLLKQWKIGEALAQ